MVLLIIVALPVSPLYIPAPSNLAKLSEIILLLRVKSSRFRIPPPLSEVLPFWIVSPSIVTETSLLSSSSILKTRLLFWASTVTSGALSSSKSPLIVKALSIVNWPLDRLIVPPLSNVIVSPELALLIALCSADSVGWILFVACSTATVSPFISNVALSSWSRSESSVWLLNSFPCTKNAKISPSSPGVSISFRNSSTACPTSSNSTELACSGVEASKSWDRKMVSVLLA